MVAWDFPRGIVSVALLVDFAMARGIAAESVLAGTGIDVRTTRDPLAQVEAHQELAVVRNLIHCDDEDPATLGSEAGRLYHATSYGIFGYAVTSSRTVGDAIEFALRYVELTYVFCVPELRVEGDTAHLYWRAETVPSDVRSFLLARDVAATFTLMDELLGMRPEYDGERHRVSFARHLLDLPMPQANEHTAALCERQCRELLARRRERSGVARQVRDRLLAADGLRAGMEHVAADLGMNVRTLRRRLAEEGTSYRALVDEVREAFAEELLATRALSVEQVAYRLGYGEASSFIRAFRRWKRTSPRRYLTH
ncbi:AraC-like DNA-binding protein [Saccharomonospora amisosensis]|uniref:AraC-like DNA-binding protein n=1 Tax=Saccharomonospora amisosensis TaxID=1128677 RepID=A0A7X5ZQZ1_9PSEU|nr:AraC family transcriptional regulator [Saccharomonospora amisosensis]NIJ11785.1 AraC-like DNA-binding protein [Saccharomonospora amisosensis]